MHFVFDFSRQISEGRVYPKACLLKPGTGQTTPNQPKRAETTRTAQKPAKTTKKFSETTRNDPKIWNFPLAFVFRISSPNAQIHAIWAKKYHLSNLLTKFSMHPTSKVLISNLTLFSKILSPNAQFCAFWTRKY